MSRESDETSLFYLEFMHDASRPAAWLNDPRGKEKQIATVGIAEAYFPEYVQERVALIRAKRKISELLSRNKDKKEESPGLKSKCIEHRIPNPKAMS